jgi:IS30 family transposase
MEDDKMKKTFRKFKPSDDDYIRESIDIMSVEDIADVLGRDEKAVKRRIKRLGLEFKEEYKGPDMLRRIYEKQVKAGFVQGDV